LIDPGQAGGLRRIRILFLVIHMTAFLIIGALLVLICIGSQLPSRWASVAAATMSFSVRHLCSPCSLANAFRYDRLYAASLIPSLLLAVT
jgi:hypothetical protein